MCLRKLPEIVIVEDLPPRTSAIPDSPCGRSFPSPGGATDGRVAARYPHRRQCKHLSLRRLDVKIANKDQCPTNIPVFRLKTYLEPTPGAQSCPGGGVAMRTLNRNVPSVCWLLASE
jgi:hypothetical protein